MKTYIAHTSEIKGYRDVAETVKTVERIAASHIHALKQELLALDEYVAEIQGKISRVSVFHPKRDNPFLCKPQKGVKAVILLTGDMGLVGGLWHNLINKLLDRTVHDKAHQANQAREPYQAVIAVGTKGATYLSQEKIALIKSFATVPDSLPDESIREITEYLFKGFKGGDFSSVDILYPKFISLGRQEATLVPFLPFVFEPKAKETEGFPIFDPSKTVFFDRLLQKYITVSFRRIIVEMKLSELSARTVAMEDASVKTDQLIHKLRINFTKERHRLATQKQLETFSAHPH